MTPSIPTLSIMVFSITLRKTLLNEFNSYAKFRYAWCRNLVHYAECHNAECRGAVNAAREILT